MVNKFRKHEEVYIINGVIIFDIFLVGKKKSYIPDIYKEFLF